jgi:hypothetical protein
MIFILLTEDFEDEQNNIKSPMNLHSNIYDSSSSASSTSSINCGDLINHHNTSPLLQNRNYNILNNPLLNSVIQQNHSVIHQSSRRLNNLSSESVSITSTVPSILSEPNSSITINHSSNNSHI